VPILMVGFNRRFAPQVVKMRELLARHPRTQGVRDEVKRVPFPAEHWTQDPHPAAAHLGEACHFIDLLRHLAGSRSRRTRSRAIRGGTVRWTRSIALGFASAHRTVHYLRTPPRLPQGAARGVRRLARAATRQLSAACAATAGRAHAHELCARTRGRTRGHGFVEAVRTGGHRRSRSRSCWRSRGDDAVRSLRAGMSLGRYYHTLRHLRPVQFLRPGRASPAPPGPDLRPHAAAPSRRRPFPLPTVHLASLLGPTRFEFLNVAAISTARRWNDPAAEKLWLYNLHYSTT